MRLDKNYKVRVNPKQSRKIQELVFGLGGKWNGGADWVINEIIPFLYVTSGLVMTCDSKKQEYFGYASSENTEIQADDLIALLTDLSKSAENPLQGVELTPEFETEVSEPKFKVGDPVYFGTLEKIKTVSRVAKYNDLELDGEFGWVSGDCCCHATQENYEMLCKLYPHIKFEAPPKELKGSDLARAMLERGDRRIYGYASDNSDNDPHGYECVVRDYDVNSGFGVIMSNARYEFFNPCDPRTGEPLTEAVLDE